MTVIDSRALRLLKLITRPVLLPLLHKLGLREAYPNVPRVTIRDRLSKNQVPSRVTLQCDQTLLINGDPFFPIGLYYTRGEVEDVTGAGLRKLRDMGFNTIHFTPDLDADDQLDRVWEAGLRVWCRPPGALHGDYHRLRDVVSKFARHPALLCWETDDEPIFNQVDFVDSTTGWRIVREIDPFHPILCNQWLSDLDQEEALSRWASLADLHGFTIYPVPKWRWGKRMQLVERGWPHSIAVVGRQTDLWKSLTPNKPIIPVLQAWAWNCLEDGVAGYPSYQESRFMAYQAVIHGAKGLHYYGTVDSTRVNFACGIPPAKEYQDLEQTHEDFLNAQKYNEWFWSYFAQVIKEISRMSEIFVSEDAKWSPSIRVEASSSAEGIEHRVKRHLDSVVVLLVNALEREARIEICAPTLTNRSVKVWSQNRSIEVNSEGRFRDVVEPFGVRIYSDQPDLLGNISTEKYQEMN